MVTADAKNMVAAGINNPAVGGRVEYREGCTDADQFLKGQEDPAFTGGGVTTQSRILPTKTAPMDVPGVVPAKGVIMIGIIIEGCVCSAQICISFPVFFRKSDFLKKRGSSGFFREFCEFSPDFSIQACKHMNVNKWSFHNFLQIPIELLGYTFCQTIYFFFY